MPISFKTAALAMLLPLSVTCAAQDFLNDERLDGLDLEYVNKVYNKAYVFRDLTYFHLFASHEKGWIGGDGVYSTPLPDGNSFWSFGDSFFGVAQEFRNSGRGTNLPRNAAMIQTGEHSWRDFYVLNEVCSTDPNDRNLYMKGKTWLRHPNTAFTDEQINNGANENDRFYWPGDATVIKRDGKPVLQVLWGSIHGNMERDETTLTEYSLDGQPGDPGYMKLTALHQNVVPYSTSYGSGLLEDQDGHTYLYGSVSSGFIGSWLIVARTETHDLTSKWTYYIQDENGNWNWQEQIPTEDEMRRSQISSKEWVTEPSVFKYGDHYYMCTQIMTNSPVYIMRADHPWGPFTEQKKLYDVPSTHNDTYNCFVHPQLSRMGELVISYNMNPADATTISVGEDGKAVENVQNGFWRNFNAWGSSDLYQPHFIRVFNWQKLYGETYDGPLKDNGIEVYNTME